MHWPLHFCQWSSDEQIPPQRLLFNVQFSLQYVSTMLTASQISFIFQTNTRSIIGIIIYSTILDIIILKDLGSFAYNHFNKYLPGSSCSCLSQLDDFAFHLQPSLQMGLFLLTSPFHGLIDAFRESKVVLYVWLFGNHILHWSNVSEISETEWSLVHSESRRYFSSLKSQAPL